MVFGLFKPAYKLRIEAEPVSVPGTVNYIVVLDVQKSKEIKKLETSFVVFLEGKTRCEYTEEDSEGEETSMSRIEPFRFTLYRREKVLSEKASLDKGSYKYEVSFPVEKPLPLPGEYKQYAIRWIARAEIPGLVRSTKAEYELEVVPPREHGPAKKSTVYLGDIRVEAEIPSYIVRGRPFPIKLMLTTEKEKVECKSINAVMAYKTYISWRDVSPSADSCDIISHGQELEKKKITNHTTITRDTSLKLDLQLEIPKDKPPTFNYGSSYTNWTIKLLCDKGFLRTDKGELSITVL